MSLYTNDPVYFSHVIDGFSLYFIHSIINRISFFLTVFHLSGLGKLGDGCRVWRGSLNCKGIGTDGT